MTLCFNIFINENMSNFKWKHTLLHELAHVMLNQLEQSDKDLYVFKIRDYEDEADRYIDFLLNSKEWIRWTKKNQWQKFKKEFFQLQL